MVNVGKYTIHGSYGKQQRVDHTPQIYSQQTKTKRSAEQRQQNAPFHDILWKSTVGSQGTWLDGLWKKHKTANTSKLFFVPIKSSLWTNPHKTRISPFVGISYVCHHLLYSKQTRSVGQSVVTSELFQSRSQQGIHRKRYDFSLHSRQTLSPQGWSGWQLLVSYIYI